MLKKNSKIFIAGHNGLVGNAVKRKLLLKNYRNIITADKSKLNLLNKNKIDLFLKKKKTNNINYMCSKSRWDT